MLIIIKKSRKICNNNHYQMDHVPSILLVQGLEELTESVAAAAAAAVVVVAAAAVAAFGVAAVADL